MRCGGHKEATFLSVMYFSKGALPSSVILARPRWPVLGARVGPTLLGQQRGKGGQTQHSRSVFLMQGCLIPVQGRGDHHLLAAHRGGRQRGALQLQCVLFVPEV